VNSGFSRVGDPREIIVGPPIAYSDGAELSVAGIVVFTRLSNDDAAQSCGLPAGEIIFISLPCCNVL